MGNGSFIVLPLLSSVGRFTRLWWSLVFKIIIMNIPEDILTDDMVRSPNFQSLLRLLPTVSLNMNIELLL